MKDLSERTPREPVRSSDYLRGYADGWADGYAQAVAKLGTPYDEETGS